MYQKTIIALHTDEEHLEVYHKANRCFYRLTNVQSVQHTVYVSTDYCRLNRTQTHINTQTFKKVAKEINLHTRISHPAP